MTILIRIVGGYGLGDVCEFGVVLKHLARYRPAWTIDVQANPNTFDACTGLCRAVFSDAEPANPANYDQTLDVRLYDHQCNFPDRPNTKTTGCLHEVFGIPYDDSLGRYQVQVSDSVAHRIKVWLLTEEIEPVIVHYEGSSNPHKKNLAHWQAREICDLIRAYGLTPLLIDRDKTSPLDERRVPDWISGAGGLAGLIGQSRAYIGIDSGPGHVASTTETRSLICWTKHHPIAYHDPAPNTVHLLPWNHTNLAPANIPAVLGYFREHYQYRTYSSESDLINSINAWLALVLMQPQHGLPPVVFIVSGELPLLLRALRKMRPICGARGARLQIAVDRHEPAYAPLVPFLRRFAFVRSAVYTNQRIEFEPNTRGHRVFVSDGRRDNGDFYLCPNGEAWGRDWPDDPALFDGFDYSGVDGDTQALIDMTKETACPSS